MRGNIITTKPTYVWRPDTLARRYVRALRGSSEPVVTLPWGARLQVNREDEIGSGIARRSVHELAVTEAIWRLTEPDDLALDVGANVGYFTALLAARARRVIAFEPHPRTVDRLRANTRRWSNCSIIVHESAVSDVTGVARLVEPFDFAHKSGTPHMAGESPVDGHRSYEVKTTRLDELLGDESVGVLKLDAEGHELAVLEGALEALGQRRIRDILFESHDALPTSVSERLVRCGYEIFAINQRFRGAELAPPELREWDWDAPMYLATLNPARASARVRPDGWRSLRPMLTWSATGPVSRPHMLDVLGRRGK